MWEPALRTRRGRVIKSKEPEHTPQESMLLAKYQYFRQKRNAAKRSKNKQPLPSDVHISPAQALKNSIAASTAHLRAAHERRRRLKAQENGEKPSPKKPKASSSVLPISAPARVNLPPHLQNREKNEAEAKGLSFPPTSSISSTSSNSSSSSSHRSPMRPISKLHGRASSSSSSSSSSPSKSVKLEPTADLSATTPASSASIPDAGGSGDAGDPGDGLTEEERAKRERVKRLLMGKKEKDSGRVIGTVQEGLTAEEVASRERVKRLLAGKRVDRGGLTVGAIGGDDSDSPSTAHVPSPPPPMAPEVSVKVESNYLDGAGESKAASDFDDTAAHAAKPTPSGGFKRPVRKLKRRKVDDDGQYMVAPPPDSPSEPQDRSDSGGPTQIYVGNLPRDDNLDPEVLIEHFGQAGTITDVNVYPEKGFAFITYEESHMANTAIRTLNRKTLPESGSSNTLRVSWARKKDDGLKSEPPGAKSSPRGKKGRSERRRSYERSLEEDSGIDYGNFGSGFDSDDGDAAGSGASKQPADDPYAAMLDDHAGGRQRRSPSSKGKRKGKRRRQYDEVDIEDNRQEEGAGGGSSFDDLLSEYDI